MERDGYAKKKGQFVAAQTFVSYTGICPLTGVAWPLYCFGHNISRKCHCNYKTFIIFYRVKKEMVGVHLRRRLTLTNQREGSGQCPALVCLPSDSPHHKKTKNLQVQ